MNRDKFFRRLNGEYNNVENPYWGASNTPFMRAAETAYGDGHESIAIRLNCDDGCMTDPRHISNCLCHQDEISENEQGLSDFVWVWGQFIDQETARILPSDSDEREDILVGSDDPFFEPGSVIPFLRSADYIQGEVHDHHIRQQYNAVSSFIDGSNIYGSDTDCLKKIRCFDGTGKLKTDKSSCGDLLPRSEQNSENIHEHDHSGDGFFIGNPRVNEHVVLASMHTLFVREHNRWCDYVVTHNPLLQGKDEEIFELARKLVCAVLQRITYEEYLPALLGYDALSAYDGYKANVDPSLSDVFVAACNRMGHSMVPEKLKMGKGETFLALRESYFNPSLIREKGIEPFLEGRFHQKMMNIDLKISGELRNFLFSKAEKKFQPVMDLAAIDIQRGRDHGLPDYNTAREAFGLSRKTDISDITNNFEIQQQLLELYKDIDQIDPWVGGLAEDHHSDAQVGEFVFTVIKDQFERMRDGDRFWYQNDMILQRYQDQIREMSLAKVISLNTHLGNIPDDVFRVL